MRHPRGQGHYLLDAVSAIVLSHTSGRELQGSAARLLGIEKQLLYEGFERAEIRFIVVIQGVIDGAVLDLLGLLSNFRTF
jgi:hypothetical protein